MFRVSQFHRDMNAVNIPADGTERPTYIWDRMAQSMPRGEDCAKPQSMIRSIFLAKLDPSIRDHITDMQYE